MTDDNQQIVTVDIGGTHARFAIAELASGRRPMVGPHTVLPTAEFASLTMAWRTFLTDVKGAAPKAASICIAAPVRGSRIKLTNSPWLIQPEQLEEELDVDRLHLMNDFGALAHAADVMSPDEYETICGPDKPLPELGVVTVLGPGTGLGAAALIRNPQRHAVVETEGGHMDFAPLDELESAIVDRLRSRFLRVSVERIVSGPGLDNLCEALSAIEAHPYQPRSDAALWAAALDGSDIHARSALDRLCLSFGSVAGDLALAQGANAVVLVGSLSRRLAPILRQSGFSDRFCAKGRYQQYMSEIPVKLVTHDQPGLLGAAVAFQNRFFHSAK